MNCGATSFYGAVYWIAEMFSLTHELSYYCMSSGTSARFHFSIMEGFINRLRKIGNLVKTCEEPMLMKLYEVVCKGEDDLRISPLEKQIRIRPMMRRMTSSFGMKAHLVAVMIAVQHQALKKMNMKLHQRREVFTEDDGSHRASDFEI
ncbi:hypothetical protein Tco_0630519 [Tanacetum coccineum]